MYHDTGVRGVEKRGSTHRFKGVHGLLCANVGNSEEVIAKTTRNSLARRCASPVMPHHGVCSLFTLYGAFANRRRSHTI